MASAKLERLMNLVAALLHTRVPLAASVLRERVGGYSSDPIAFHRQFARDKEDLREMGIPILVEPVPDSKPQVDGYRIDPDQYYLGDPGLEPDELAALHLATRLIETGGSAGSAGLLKLGGVIGNVHGDVPPFAPVSTDPALGVLFDALRRRRRVSFDYRNRRRSVVPRALSFQNGHWYLAGFDLDATVDKVFRLNRIHSAVDDEGEAVEVPSGTADLGPFKPWRVGEEDTITARIRVDASLVPSVSAQVGRDRLVSIASDGSGEFTMEIASREGFRAWIIQLGAAVAILEPEILREELIEWVTTAREVVA